VRSGLKGEGSVLDDRGSREHDDGRGPKTSPNASPTKRRFGPTIRAMTKKI